MSFVEGFLTAPSPGMVSAIVLNEHYPSEEAYLEALAEALRVEYETIVDSGFLLQLDCPDLARERHNTYQDQPLEDFLGFAGRVIDAINHALRNIPRDRVRMHVCWGNYEGPHDCDVPLEDVIPVMRRAKVGGFVLPFANPRHAHEFRYVKDLLVDDEQTIVAGVIDTTTNFVEHPEVVADRLERVAAVIGDPQSSNGWNRLRLRIHRGQGTRCRGCRVGQARGAQRRRQARVLALVLEWSERRGPAACSRRIQKQQLWEECHVQSVHQRPQVRRRPPPLLCASLALFSTAATAAETWKFYMHQSAPNFATSRGAKLLTEEIEKATNGELKMQLHLSGTLQISPSDITKAVGENIVQLGDDLFNSGNIPLAGIPRLPMLVQSYEDFTKAAAVLQPYIEKAFAAKGSTVLAAYSYPMQVVWGKKKLESLEDIKGLKLRVAAPEQGEFVRRFGGTSITMSAPEVPSALDRGVVDGIFTAGVGAVLWKDLLKYGFLIVVNVNNSYIIANTEAFNKLSPDLQAKLRKVAADIGRWNQDTMKTEEAASQKTLGDAGYVLTQAKPAEIAKAVETMKPYWDEWAKSRGPEVVEALGKVRAALGR